MKLAVARSELSKGYPNFSSFRLHILCPNSEQAALESASSAFHILYTQWCIFLEQEGRENRLTFVALPREFPLSVCVSRNSEFFKIIHILVKYMWI